MYFVQLFKYNKYLFTAFAGFLLLHIYLNVKRGVHISPIHHYGMFAHSIPITDTLFPLLVYADNKLVQAKDLNIIEWDIIIASPGLFADHFAVNKNVRESFRHMNPKLELPAKDTIGEQQRFSNWYKDKLSEILKRDVSHFSVFIQPSLCKAGLVSPASYKKILLSF